MMNISRIACALVLCSLTYAQSFEVASIYPHKGPNVNHFDRLPGNHEIRTSSSLWSLVAVAYYTRQIFIADKKASWITNDWWDLDAKAEQRFTEPELMIMLQNLLADRFKLQVEKEQKPGTIYTLTVDTGGLKLLKSKDEAAYPTDRVIPDRPGSEDTGFVRSATAISMSQFAFGFPFQNLRAPVVDATGLLDRYDIHFVLASLSEEPAAIIEACKKQLGLRLEPGQGQIQTITVLHAEKPSEN